MEKKKLLLVAISVGVFLVIVVGASLLIFSPGNDSAAKRQALTPEISTGVDPWETDQNTEQSAQTDSRANFRPNSEPQFSTSSENEPVKPAENVPVTITVPQPHAAAVPDIPVAAQKPAAKPVQTKPVTKPDTPKVVQPKPVPAPAVVAKPRTETKAYNDYWIQTGAFSTKVRAEGAKESLADKGIASVIDNSNVNGKTWYRVRVGPYISENEANYWLALVKAIDGFSDSQVRLAQR